MITIRYDRRV